jgi:hypothetical protein
MANTFLDYFFEETDAAADTTNESMRILMKETTTARFIQQPSSEVAS